MEENIQTEEYRRLLGVVSALRGENGCPWDREQTHESLKPECIEEAAEIIAGINIMEKTKNADNFIEELGDMLFQIVMHARIGEEKGLFTMEDVCRSASEKMIRRHPHVFGSETVNDSGEVVKNWEEIKKLEKAGKEWMNAYLPEAFTESKTLIDKAMDRKGIMH